MRTVHVSASGAYDVLIGGGLLLVLVAAVGLIGWLSITDIQAVI